MRDNQALLSFAGKLTLLQPDFHDPDQGRTAYITKDFNTGWMYGGNRECLCVILMIQIWWHQT